MNLYDLTQSQLQLLQMIEDGIDVLDTLEANKEAIEDKLEGYAKIIKMMEGNISVIKAEEQRLQKKRSVYENGVERLEKAVYQSMIDTGNRKVEGKLFKFSIANNPASVEVLDDSLIPKGYFVQPAPTLDKNAIKEELKLGHEVPGVQLKVGESLRIK